MGEPVADERRALRHAASLVFVDDLAAPTVDPEDAAHLTRVLRLKADEQVALSDGAGSFRLARLTGTDAGRARRGQEALGVRDLGAICFEAPRDEPVVVGFALQKGERPELAIQKLTELGVDEIVPFVSERTIVRLAPEDAEARAARWRKVAREAARQSRRVRLPALHAPRPLTEALAALGRPVYFAEPGAAPLAAEVRAVFVGPEGGFSSAELALAAGLVELGSTVLRAETAAITVGALLVALTDHRVRPAGRG